jgi:membrane protein DedA with SNARE-associated domain
MSAVVLASGAMGVKRFPFITAFGIAKFVRFSVVAVLAPFYGKWILRIMRLEEFRFVIVVFAILAIGSTALGIYRISHRHR